MSSRRVVIVGAGVIGLSTAYHLAKRRCAQVVVVDKGPVGDGSSSRAAGIITGHLWTEAGIRVRKKCLELYRELSQELDGYQFQNVGCLNLFDPESWAERESLFPTYKRLDVPFEVLDQAEMKRRWPTVEPRREFIGLYDPLGGYSEPDEYLPALTRKSLQLGVEIREGQKVLDFLTRNGRITGVRTAGGEIEADAVIGTVHAWNLALFERLGLRLPLKTFVHQRYVSAVLPRPLKIPAINANPLGGYIRPASGGRALIGYETPDREEYRVASTDFRMSTLSAATDPRERVMKDFGLLVPEFANTSMETERVGLIMFSLDGEPVLGPVAKLPGLYVTMAFHSGGFAYNPGAGFLMAEYVAEGKTSIDITSFSPDRFSSEDADSYLSTTVKQKDALRRRH